MRRTTRRRAVGLLVAMMGLVVALAAPASAQAPAAQTAGGKTTTTWYFYKVKWGFQDEFMTLFQKNHYPLLKAGVTDGRFVSLKTYVPRYHGDGRADWTFAVEIVAKVCGMASQSTGASLRFMASSLEICMNVVNEYSPAAIRLIVCV